MTPRGTRTAATALALSAVCALGFTSCALWPLGFTRILDDVPTELLDAETTCEQAGELWGKHRSMRMKPEDPTDDYVPKTQAIAKEMTALSQQTEHEELGKMLAFTAQDLNRMAIYIELALPYYDKETTDYKSFLIGNVAINQEQSEHGWSEAAKICRPLLGITDVEVTDTGSAYVKKYEGP